MDLVDRRAVDAIAVESRELDELEGVAESETLTFDDVAPSGLALNLSPSTWSAFEGFPLDYWENGVAGDTAQVTGGSS
jgi:hypothetical protein